MDAKEWYKSKTIWAGIIGGIAGLLQIANIVIIPADQQTAIVGGILAFINVYAGIRAVQGRKQATTGIK